MCVCVSPKYLLYIMYVSFLNYPPPTPQTRFTPLNLSSNTRLKQHKERAQDNNIVIINTVVCDDKNDMVISVHQHYY